jgi:hypothetical protein
LAFLVLEPKMQKNTFIKQQKKAMALRKVQAQAQPEV